MTARKVKLSVTVAADLVERLERAKRRAPSQSLSSVVEAWLRRGARADAESELRNATVRYYEGMSESERRDDEALARALSRAARRLDVDERAVRRGNPRR